MQIVDSLAVGTSDALEQIAALRRLGYEPADLGAIARNVAALWERSLKASEGTWRRLSLWDVTRALEASGWTTGAKALDVIRDAANRDKHEANPSHDADELTDSLRILNTQLRFLPRLIVGVRAELPAALRIRRMVCAVYDIFHAGETIYSFLEADESDSWQSTRQIDEFQIENRNASVVEYELRRLPGYAENPLELDELRRSLLDSDVDLCMVLRLEASYQQIYDILSPFQHSMPLIHGLHREDDPRNVVASVAQSLITGQSLRLGERAHLDLGRIHMAVQDLIDSVPDRLKPLRLDRCSAATFSAESGKAVAVDKSLGALVTAGGVILVRAD